MSGKNRPVLKLKRKVDKTLSGGERKRIELAAIFAMRPQLAILDELDSGIDILALDIMKELGFTKVYNMLGGITQWEAERLPIIK